MLARSSKKWDVSLLLILLILISGCGPSIKTIIKMQPILGYDAYKLDESDSSVSLTKDDVKVTVAFQDRNKLEGMSKSISTNPFLSENKIFFTIFSLTIENNRKDKISFDPVKCVILDGLSGQFNGLTVETLRSLYPSTYTQYYTYSYVFDEYSPNLAYTDDYYKRRVAEEKMIKGGEVYPGVKRNGLLVFDRISREATNITLLIPAVTLYKGNEETAKIDFKFQFLQEVRIIRD